jgi:hypothetical protein
MGNAILVVVVAFSYMGGLHNPHNFINEYSHLAPIIDIIKKKY